MATHEVSPPQGNNIGPTPDRPSHSTARDKGLIHPTPHCVRRGAVSRRYGTHALTLPKHRRAPLRLNQSSFRARQSRLLSVDEPAGRIELGCATREIAKPKATPGHGQGYLQSLSQNHSLSLGLSLSPSPSQNRSHKSQSCGAIFKRRCAARRRTQCGVG